MGIITKHDRKLIMELLNKYPIQGLRMNLFVN